MIDLKGKTAVITGSARGIGRAIAEALAEAGANVVISDINQEASDATAKEIADKYQVEAIGVTANVAKKAETDELINKAIEKFGQIDIMVNNAGITKDNLLMRMSEDEWDAVLTVNLKGVFNGIQSVTRPMMKARSGKIINIASVVGITGNAGQANYSAAKAGVIGLTKTTARELAARGVNVNAVAPGFIATDMTDKLSDEVKENINTRIPFGKMGTAQDVANAVRFLSSEDAAYITGQVVNVCGGMNT